MICCDRMRCSMPSGLHRCVCSAICSFALLLNSLIPGHAQAGEDSRPIRVGIIGLDTSHVIHFTKLLNAPNPRAEFRGCRIVAAYPQGSPDIESSTSRIGPHTKQINDMGVEIVGTIDELLQRVDAVLLETNDGRPHLEQALPVLKSRKRLFIDKPMAASLTDVIAIFEAAKHYDTPVFSSSALRFGIGTQAVAGGAIGDVLACDVHSPCHLEATHTDFSWYGVHGVEALFTVMGTGCQSVARTSTDDQELAVGVWKSGRIGTYRGMRVGAMPYGGMAFGTSADRVVGTYDGYEPLVAKIVQFFLDGNPPVAAEETIEIFAFIEAADRSKRSGGTPVNVTEIIKSATNDAARLRTW
jgi:hypothetical protein